MSGARGPLSEGESNRSDRRAGWADDLGPKARTLVARDAELYLHQSVSTPCLSAVHKAEGIWIEDPDGCRYMDFHGNSVHHIGYGHPRLKAAVAQQMDDLPFAPRRYACQPAVELAEKLTALAPKGLDRLLLATGGSDAVEIALKIARISTGRFKTLSFWDAFHGAGFGSAAVGGESLFRSHGIGPLLPGTEHVAPFDCYRCPYGHERPETCGLACAEMIAYVLEKEGDVAAVIAEPARAVPYVPPPGFWQRVREACDAHGTLLIFDEIPTGLGKTGRMFACDHDGVVPDILVLGKALGGGLLPIAATLCRAELDVAEEAAIGHYTHEKNPVMARAALTTLEIIEDEELVENAAIVGAHALSRLEEMNARDPRIGDVRGRGLLLGVEFVGAGGRAPDADLAEAMFYALLSRGVSAKVTMGNVLTLSPPLIITKAQMDLALDALEASLREHEGA